MAKDVILKSVKCPNCGYPLKYENNVDTVECVCCGSSFVPVEQSAPAAEPASAATASLGGVLKVDGIKTSSSALAYIEQFFEDYDWEAFAYAQTLSVSEIDKLADSLKVTSADDKKTWFVCFKAMSVPFLHKIEGCKQILASVIEEYKKDNLDAYSKFDAYKRVSAMIARHKDRLVTTLEKLSANAGRYGASPEELGELTAEIETIRQAAALEFYAQVDAIPEIQQFNRQKDADIAAALAAKGIKADMAYARAKELIEQQHFVEALHILRSLDGYADSKALIHKVDKYFLLSDVLEIEGTLYYFKKESDDSTTVNLYPTVNGKISDQAIIRNIGQIITNYADILYYLDGIGRLKKCNLSTNVEETLFEKYLDSKSIHVRNRKVYMLADKSDSDTLKQDLVELDLSDGTVRTLLVNIGEIVSFKGGKLVFTVLEKTDDPNGGTITNLNILNVDTMDITPLGSEAIKIVGFVKNLVVYTQEAPNQYNKKLYVKSLNTSLPASLIEENIYRFCTIIAGKLFYYVGNSRNCSLIHINTDGTERKEWPLYISEVLFEQGGWLYFIRKRGYNAILCKSRLDGSRFKVIASDIDSFLDIKNGYLYYINNDSKLVKVRMDGSNLQVLCNNVQSVLSIKEDRIVFVSGDDSILVQDTLGSKSVPVKSIYMVDFSGGGKKKLAYNIRNAKEYDDNTVYFLANQTNDPVENEADAPISSLFRLDVETQRIDKLLDLEVEKTPAAPTNHFVIAMIVMAIAFFFAIIGFMAEAPGLGIIGLITGAVAGIVGAMIKYKESES